MPSPATDINNEGESCSKDDCPNGLTDGETLASPSVSDLAELPDPGWWDLLGKTKAELVRITGTLYDTLNSITSKFADIVRQIMNEELYDILAKVMAKVGYVMFQPGE